MEFLKCNVNLITCAILFIDNEVNWNLFLMHELYLFYDESVIPLAVLMVLVASKKLPLPGFELPRQAQKGHRSVTSVFLRVPRQPSIQIIKTILGPPIFGFVTRP